jgi:hypothetical protein
LFCQEQEVPQGCTGQYADDRLELKQGWRVFQVIETSLTKPRIDNGRKVVVTIKKNKRDDTIAMELNFLGRISPYQSMFASSSKKNGGGWLGTAVQSQNNSRAGEYAILALTQ